MKLMIDALEARRLLADTWSTYAQLIGQDDLVTDYASLTGKGQTVAVIDTGIDYRHASLGGGFGSGKKVVAGYDFVDNDADPMDKDGHGTAVAGMIAASKFTQDGITYQGIAPEAQLVALRAGTDSGFSDANIQKALQWVINHHKKYGITVVNLSLGGDTFSKEQVETQYADEFAKLTELGIALIGASGNDGDTDRDAVSYPAADPDVYAIGSVSADNKVSYFTNRGSTLDLLAPGERIVTTKMGGGYETTNGTSFAAPLVAGVFAVIYQATRNLAVGDVMSALRSSSRTQYDGDGDPGLATQRAYAQLDLPAAIKLAQSRDNVSSDTYFSANKSVRIDSAYDSSGVLHLAYYDTSKRKVVYVTQSTTGKWSKGVIVDKSNADTGPYLSLAIDPTGKVGIAYYDATNADLKYAWWSGSKWGNTTLDNKAAVGQFASLTYAASGNPYIAYYRKSTGDLRMMNYSRATGEWTRQTIDSAGDVGQHASIGYFRDNEDDSETIAIGYADSTNGNLKYWRNNTRSAAFGGGIYSTVVDDLDGVSNIKLSMIETDDSEGAVRIAYQDVRNADVKYAYRMAGNWYTVQVATAGNVGSMIDTYLDRSKNYHVVYYDRTKGASYDALIGRDLQVDYITRIGTAGMRATVAAHTGGTVTFTAINKAQKSIAATVLA